MTLHAADDDRALVDGAVPDRLTVAFGDDPADAQVRFKNVDEVKPYLRFADAPA